MSFTLETLDERIALRAAASPDESYTAKLLAAGVQIQDADRAVGGSRGGQDGKADRKKSDERAHRGIRKDKPSPGTWQYDEDKKCSV